MVQYVLLKIMILERRKKENKKAEELEVRG